MVCTCSINPDTTVGSELASEQAQLPIRANHAGNTLFEGILCHGFSRVLPRYPCAAVPGQSSTQTKRTHTLTDTAGWSRCFPIAEPTIRPSSSCGTCHPMCNAVRPCRLTLVLGISTLVLSIASSWASSCKHDLHSAHPTLFRYAEGGAISGATAFDLWETSGFPLDLTQLMAEEDGLEVDVPGYGAAMEAAREKSRAGAHCAWCTTDRLCGLWSWSTSRASPALPGLGQHTTVRSQELHRFCSLCMRFAP